MLACHIWGVIEAQGGLLTGKKKEKGESLKEDILFIGLGDVLKVSNQPLSA